MREEETHANARYCAKPLISLSVGVGQELEVFRQQY